MVQDENVVKETVIEEIQQNEEIKIEDLLLVLIGMKGEMNENSCQMNRDINENNENMWQMNDKINKNNENFRQMKTKMNDKINE